MGVTKEQVESTLNSKLSPQRLEIIDTSGGCGASFAIEIVSAQFEGKRLLERHRMVNTALEDEMKEIHALSIKKAMTPEQWKQQQESEKSTSAASSSRLTFKMNLGLYTVAEEHEYAKIVPEMLQLR